MKNTAIKTLNKSVNFCKHSQSGIIREIIELPSGRKFKLCVGIENGSDTIEASIMDSDGVFKFVLGKYDVGFRYSVSYVSDDTQKTADLEKALVALKEVIVKVYA